MTSIDRGIVTAALPDTPAFWGPGGAPATNVAALLQQTGLAYDDLLDLLWSDYVSPGQTVTITFPAGDCALASASLTGATPAFYARLHRFTRLCRKTGWTAFELDAAIRALAPHDLTDDLLVALSDVEALRRALGVDVVPILACWGTIDAKEPRGGSASLHESVFQNKTVIDDGERAFFAYDAASGDLASAATAHWMDHEPAICAALGLSSDDLALLTDATAAMSVAVGPEIAETVDPALSIGNLTRLYRFVTLARALQLSVRQLLALRALTSVDPFASPAAARSLLAALKQIRASRFTLEQLDELLRSVVPPGGSSFILPDAALVLLQTLRAGLLQIQQANALVADPVGDVTRKALAAALSPAQADAADIDTLVAIIGGSAALSTTEAQQKATLETALVPILGASYVQGSIEPVVFGAPSPSPAARFAVVLEGLLPYLQRMQSASLVTTKLAAQLRLDVGSTAALLGQAIPSPITSGQPAMGDLLAPAFLAGAPIAAGDPVFQGLYRTLLLVSKVSFLVTRFGMTYAELTFTLAPGAAPLVAGSDARVGWVSLALLPLDPPSGPATTALFAAWAREADVFAFRDRFAVPGAGVLSGILAVAADATKTAADVTAAICALTGWASADVQALAGPGMLRLAHPADFFLGDTYARLTRCVDAFGRLGVSADRARPWAYPGTLTSPQAADVKTAAKAKHDPASWAAVARPLQDALRSAQRDALVAWLVGNAGYADADAIFDALLIDSQMCPCMLTSRIQQALGSTQLFIQRALMGDPRVGVTLTADQAAEWHSFEGRYRLWQANRQVFLYPESWLDPTLRDDKTPFFLAFEDELNQSSITSGTAETALRHYLEALEEVSRLEVVALCEDVLEQVVHVLARTHDQNAKYFYRTRVGAPYLSWTPWREVALDITGDHVVIVVWNRRVHVVWAVFTEQATNERPKSIANPTTKGVVVGFPETEYQVQLAFSALEEDKWTPKRTTVASVTTHAPIDEHSLETRLEQDDRGGEDLVVYVRVPKEEPNTPSASPDDLSNNAGTHVVDDYLGFRFPSYGGEAVTFDGPVGVHDAYPDSLEPVAQWLHGRATGPLLLQVQGIGAMKVFGATMTDYDLAMLRQNHDYDANRPFFFQDLRRVFFGWGIEPLAALSSPGSVDPATVARVAANVPYVVSPPATADGKAESPRRARRSSCRRSARDASAGARDRRPLPRAAAERDRAVPGVVATTPSRAPRPRRPRPTRGPRIPAPAFQLLDLLPPVRAGDASPAEPLRRSTGCSSWDTQRQALPAALLPVQLLDETNTGKYRFAAGAPARRVGRAAVSRGGRRLRGRRRLRPVQLGDLLPRAADDRDQAEPEPAVRRGAALVPLHLRPHRHRVRPRARHNAHFWKVKKFFDDAKTTPVPTSVTQLLSAARGGGERTGRRRAQPPDRRLPQGSVQPVGHRPAAHRARSRRRR